MTSFGQILRLFALVALFFADGTPAQSVHAGLRDPTLPPTVVASPTGSANARIGGFRPEHLVIVGGMRYLMWNGARYAAGDTIQGARIERITESEVWLRDSGGLRKLPLFSGVEKRSNSSPAQKTMHPHTAPDGKNGTIK